MATSQSPLGDLGPVIKACLGAGIPGIATPPLVHSMLTAEIGDVIAEGLAPVAVNLMTGESVPVDDPLRKQLFRAAMAQQARTLAAEAIIGQIVGLLAEGGVEFVIVKGPAVARLYPDGWPRSYNDIDLLAEPRQFNHALTLLLGNGFSYPATSLPPWPWFDRYCREGLNLLGAGNVDLHHHLAPWVFGSKLRSSDVIDRAIRVPLREGTIPVASPEHSSVIAALHILNDLWKGRRGLVSWRDLILIIRRLGFSRVREMFVHSRLEWLLQVAVYTIQVHLPGLLDDVEASSSAFPARLAWRMRGLGWDHSTAISRHRLSWAIRLPLPQASAFILGSGVPSRRYIRIRHGTYRNYWRHAWAETVSTFEGADHRMEKVGGMET